MRSTRERVALQLRSCKHRIVLSSAGAAGAESNRKACINFRRRLLRQRGRLSVVLCHRNEHGHSFGLHIFLLAIFAVVYAEGDERDKRRAECFLLRQQKSAETAEKSREGERDTSSAVSARGERLSSFSPRFFCLFSGQQKGNAFRRCEFANAHSVRAALRTARRILK